MSSGNRPILQVTAAPVLLPREPVVRRLGAPRGPEGPAQGLQGAVKGAAGRSGSPDCRAHVPLG